MQAGDPTENAHKPQESAQGPVLPLYRQVLDAAPVQTTMNVTEIKTKEPIMCHPRLLAVSAIKEKD
jgi:hypothetical protein